MSNGHSNPRLKERYRGELVPRLISERGYRNPMEVPRLEKIVVNMGVGKALQDKNRMEQAVEQLSNIAGQKAQVTKAKVAVSHWCHQKRTRP